MNQPQHFKSNKGKKSEPSQPALIASQSFYQGQIPPPEMMEHYKMVDEDFPKRIIKMAEDEARHRHESEASTRKMLVRTSYLGMIFAFLSVLIVSTIVFYTLYKGYAWEASTIATGVIVGIAGVFLYRRKNK